MVGEDVKLIVIHCADTYREMDIGVREIDRWHKENGWEGIGYHFVVRRSGVIESGRPLDQSMVPGWQVKQGAHVSGHNTESVGICMVGGKALGGGPENNFTPEQFNSLFYLVQTLKRCFPAATVVGHCDLDSHKSCPCFDVKEWWFRARCPEEGKR